MKPIAISFVVIGVCVLWMLARIATLEDQCAALRSQHAKDSQDLAAASQLHSKAITDLSNAIRSLAAR